MPLSIKKPAILAGQSPLHASTAWLLARINRFVWSLSLSVVESHVTMIPAHSVRVTITCSVALPHALIESAVTNAKSVVFSCLNVMLFTHL